MNILLINPIARAWAKPNCFPSGLGYLSAVLKQEGHNVDILDLNAWRVLDGISRDFIKYDLIGITGIITQYSEVKRLANEIREYHPNTPIACGGPLATSVPDLLLLKTEVDTCIIGEGEEVIFDLIDDILERQSIVSKYHSKTVLIKNISSIPWPDYQSFPIEVYIQNPLAFDNLNKWKDGEWVKTPRRSLNMIGSRGCVANCIYCYHNYMGDGWRIRKPDEILGEMSLLKNKYDIEYIHFVDDAFACSKKKIMEFCKWKMISEVRDVKWSCSGRADIVDEEMIATMAESGCEGICYGLESGSQRILDVMNKRISVKQYEDAIDLNKKYFDGGDYTFIIGSPGEIGGTIQESIDFCKRNEIAPTAVFYMTPYPGTELFRYLLDNDESFFAVYQVDFEEYILSLGEQGEKIVWNCSELYEEELQEWHQKFLEETQAWNHQKH